jgi:hypothetical protein
MFVAMAYVATEPLLFSIIRIIIFNFFILARINELKKVKVQYGKSKDSKGNTNKNARITIPESKTDTIKRGVSMRMKCCCHIEGTQL